MKDQAELQAEFDWAQAQVEKGIVHIEKQRALVTHRLDHGGDVAQARDLLATLEETQCLHVEHRDRLRGELNEAISEQIRRLVARRLTPAHRAAGPPVGASHLDSL